MSLRVKLLLVACVLLAVPLTGYRYVIAMEQFLREHQAQAALDSARTLALALSGDAQLFSSTTRSGQRAAEDTLFVHPVAQSLQIDGYDEDWTALDITPHRSTFDLRAASDERALFILLRLQATSPTRAPPRLRLILEDAPAFRRAWLLDPGAPGAMTVREVPPAPGLTSPAHADARLQAAMQRQGPFLNYEIRIPFSLGITTLAFEVLVAKRSAQDRRSFLDEAFDGLLDDSRQETRHGSPGDEVKTRLPRSGALHVRFAPRKLGALLQSWTPSAGRRLRVIDTEARVIAQAGDVARKSRPSGVSTALEQFVDTHDDRLLTLAPVTLKLSGSEVDAALAGTPAVRIRRAETTGPLVVSAAYPLHDGDALLGALILEESTSPAQNLAKHALLELLLATGAAFLIGASVLLIVSARIVARLRVLRAQAAATVDDSGRVLKSFHVPSETDEIGDLGRSFGAAVSRLQAYQDYLEKLAQRLSHELRTPLTVIRSSLDNLSMTGATGQGDVYINRAQSGVERLESIVRRMSEAARLEQAMADSERSTFDLVDVVRAVLPTYQQSWPEWRFDLHVPSQPCVVNGSAELIVQALDKLLSNARDFADADTAISIHLGACAADNPHAVQLMVCNTGARLPAGDPAQLFESMNSQRHGATHESAEAHLGFGLYVVRLVAEFHGGQAFARDEPNSRTVCIGVQLPRHSPSPAGRNTGMYPVR